LAGFGKVFFSFMISGVGDTPHAKERNFIYMADMSHTGSFHIYTKRSEPLVDAVSPFVHNKLFSGDHSTKMYGVVGSKLIFFCSFQKIFVCFKIVVFQPGVKFGQYPFCHIMINNPGKIKMVPVLCRWRI